MASDEASCGREFLDNSGFQIKTKNGDLAVLRWLWPKNKFICPSLLEQAQAGCLVVCNGQTMGSYPPLTKG